MRTHLQHHDAGALVGDLPLLAQILFDLIRQYDAKHRKSADDDTDDEQFKYGGEKMDARGDHHWEQSDEKGDIASLGQPVPPVDHADKVENHDRVQTGQHQWIQGAEA